MSMLLTRNFIAGAAMTAYRIVRFSAADTVVLAAAATESLIGVTNDVAAASGERQDVIVQGMPWVEAGAAFSIGALLTSDASGRAVAAAPAAGVNNRIIGIAFRAAVAAGDRVEVLLAPGSIQG